MGAKFDWTALTCIMPTLRGTFSDDDKFSTFIEPCGHPLHLVTTSSESLHAGGEASNGHPTWEVRCEAGHVVFLPDDEGNEYAMPFMFADAIRALGYVSEQVSDE